jgi:hypothetical protein
VLGLRDDGEQTVRAVRAAVQLIVQLWEARVAEREAKKRK